VKIHADHKKLGVIDYDEVCEVGLHELLSSAEDHSFCALLVTGAPKAEPSELLLVAKSVGDVIPAGWSADGKTSDLLYSVQSDPEAFTKIREATGYRMATKLSEGMVCHTDGYGLAQRPDYVVLQCIRVDSDGGRTTLVFSDDIQSRLTLEDQALLAEPIWPSERGMIPVIHRHPTSARCACLEFNSQYIHSHIDRNPSLMTPRAQAVLAHLDTLCHWTSAPCRFALRPREILIVNNRCVLHGREPFLPSSDRLLQRAWVLDRQAAER
jgi:alpha-ketoglutarate-dependent taurine dioxygenase